jgi:MFS transporter, SET family, sugar efflux transporter
MITQHRTLLALVLLNSAAGFSALAVVALFARDQVGASDTGVTLYFVAVAMAGMVVLPTIGWLSDRAGARRVLVPASLGWLAVGCWVLAGVRSYTAMLVVGLVFFCVLSVPSAQLLAYARDLAARTGGAASLEMVSRVRIVFSIGSFAGFAIGGIGLAAFGARGVFRITGVACAICLVLALKVLRPVEPAVVGVELAKADPGDAEAAGAAEPGAGRLLIGLAGAMVLYSSGRMMVLSQLPILMHASLHAPSALVGIALAVPPLCELALMPAMARAAVRWGRGRVFLVGAVASVGYYAGLVVVAKVWELFALQVVYAVFGAATVMVGIDLAQRLMAGRPGTATSVYLNHENVAVVSGSLIAAGAVAALGHRAGFAVPAVLCLTALGLTAVLFASNPGRFDLRLRLRAPAS